MKNRVSIYWDFENVRVPHQAKCLMNFAQSRGDVVVKKVYSHWSRETRTFEDALDDVGFERIDVQEEFKNSADLKLTSDCCAGVLSDLSPDIIILVSGDGGFASLIRALRLYGKQVIVVGRVGVTSDKLRCLANEFYLVEQ